MKLLRLYDVAWIAFRIARAITDDQPHVLQQNLVRLEHLGGVYVKFLQMLVMQSNAQAKHDMSALLSVYEHSTPDSLRIRAYIQARVPLLSAQLASIDERPFATGSFGQVYYARLRNGDEVAVKVLRPSVERYLRFDLSLLRLITTIGSMFDRQRVFNFRAIYREFRQNCLAESDYRREATQTQLQHERLYGHDVLWVPRVYMSLSTDTVMVQQLVRGFSVAQVLAWQQAGHDAREYLRTTLKCDLDRLMHVVGYELLTRALTGRVLHADPHPGNIILTAGNRVALIDFGLVTSVNSNKPAFYELVRQYARFYRGDVALDDFMIAALGLLEPKLHRALSQSQLIFEDAGQVPIDLLSRLRRLAQQAIAHGDAALAVQHFLDRHMLMKALLFVVNRDNRFGLTLNIENATILKAVQTYLVLSTQLDPTTRVIRDVLDDAMVFAGNNLESIVDQTEPSISAQEALETLSVWLDRISRRDPLIMQRLLTESSL